MWWQPFSWGFLGSQNHLGQLLIPRHRTACCVAFLVLASFTILQHYGVLSFFFQMHQRNASFRSKIAAEDMAAGARLRNTALARGKVHYYQAQLPMIIMMMSPRARISARGVTLCIETVPWNLGPELDVTGWRIIINFAVTVTQTVTQSDYKPAPAGCPGSESF